MIWVAWRQQRLQILVSVGLVALAAAVVVWVRLAAAADLTQAGMAGCWTTPNGCVGTMMVGYDRYRTVYPFAELALAGVLGTFAGAPMFTRDVESGVYTFALTQSISRARWWLTKAAVGGLPVVLAMTGLGLLNNWAAPAVPGGPIQLKTPRFETEGLSLGSLTLLAVVIGISVGLWLRNTVSALAVTLALCLVTVVGFSSGVRADVLPLSYATRAIDGSDPAVLQFPLAGQLARPGETDPFLMTDNWWQRWGFVNRDGVEVGWPGCTDADEVTSCLRTADLTGQFVYYHPASRFWPMQFIQTGAVLLLSAVLLALAAIAARRRLT